MTDERARTGSKFWLWVQWVLASAVGFALIWLATIVLLEAHIHGPLAIASAAAVTGAVSGAGQWLVLRRQASSAGWWALFSAVGWMAATAVSMKTMVPPHHVDLILVLLEAAERGLVAGVVLGLAQWHVLRRQASSAGWWVLVSASGYAVGLFIAVCTIVGVYAEPAWRGPILYVAGAVGGAVGGTLYGAITGVALALMLRRPAPETTGSGQSAAEP